MNNLIRMTDKIKSMKLTKEKKHNYNAGIHITYDQWCLVMNGMPYISFDSEPTLKDIIDALQQVTVIDV